MGMAGDVILAIDQGTTSSRAMLVDASSNVVGMCQRDIRVNLPQPGWVNQSASELWETTIAVCEEALADAALKWADLSAIGITNQRETTILWDRSTGAPLADAIVWQSRQSSDIIERWQKAGLAPAVRSTTGLVLDPYFSASKIRWLFDQDPILEQRARAGEVCFGTVDSWLIWNLTGGLHLTDVTNASRTMLFDIHRREWSSDMLDRLEIPPEILPTVVPSSGRLATSSERYGSVPIAGIAGDQHAALFGQACFKPGMAKSTYGTGSFVVMNTGARPATSMSGLLTSPAWSLPPDDPFALEGAVLVSGAAVQWLRDGLGIIGSAQEVERLAKTVSDSGGVVFVPALTGLGAPEWDSDARGTILGITRGTTAAHIARATLEAMASQVAALMSLMSAESDLELTELRVDGGAARNDLLMQLQADLLGVPVCRSAITETTALGAAWLAGLGQGIWSDTVELAAHWRSDRRFDPQMSADERLSRLDQWQRAVERSRGWIQADADSVS